MFYQQDEWRALGLFSAGGVTASFKDTSVLQMAIGFGRPLSVPFLYIFLHNFPMQIWPFAVFSIIMHTANGILVYVIASLLTGNLIAAWTAGLFFLLSYNGSQAVTWFATNISALSSVFFALLSIVLVLLYVKKKNISYIIWAQLCVIFSYLFKEFSIILIILLPAGLILFAKEKVRFDKIVKIFSPLIVYFLFAFVITLIRLLTPVKQYGVFVGQSSGGILKIVQNMILYPLLSFSQTFLPYPFVEKIYPAIKSVTSGNDVFFTFLSVLFLLGIAVTIVRCREQKKTIMFVTIYILLSFVPYAVLARGGGYLDSRYFYFGIGGAGLLYGIYVAIVFTYLRRHHAHIRNSMLFILAIIFIGYLYKNIQYIQREVASYVVVSQERISVLHQIKNIIPVPPDNPIFYITGDVENFYLIPNQRLPFQQGIGYTLMTFYYPTGKISGEFMTQNDAFLWGVNEQGYRELNGQSFGYFTDKRQLLDLLKHNSSIKPQQIIGLYYSGNAHRVIDVTTDIRQYIAGNITSND